MRPSVSREMTFDIATWSNYCNLIFTKMSIIYSIQVSGEIPCATPDNQSVRTTSGPLDPRQPGNKTYFISIRVPLADSIILRLI